MLRVVHPLIVTGLILHRWADTLIAVAVVLLPLGYESLLRIRERGVRRSEPLLRGYSATSCRRCDHVPVLADADCHVAHVHRDLSRLRVPEGLRQCPDVVVGETQRLDFRELRVFREGRQRHPEPFQCVVQGVHPMPLAIVRLYPTVPFQPEHLRTDQWFHVIVSIGFFTSPFFFDRWTGFSIRV